MLEYQAEAECGVSFPPTLYTQARAYRVANSVLLPELESVGVPAEGEREARVRGYDRVEERLKLGLEVIGLAGRRHGGEGEG